MISNGESSEPLCDSVNRGLTLVRLRIAVTDVITLIMNKFVRAQIELICRLTRFQHLVSNSIDGVNLLKQNQINLEQIVSTNQYY